MKKESWIVKKVAANSNLDGFKDPLFETNLSKLEMKVRADYRWSLYSGFVRHNVKSSQGLLFVWRFYDRVPKSQFCLSVCSVMSVCLSICLKRKRKIVFDLKRIKRKPPVTFNASVGKLTARWQVTLSQTKRQDHFKVRFFWKVFSYFFSSPLILTSFNARFFWKVFRYYFSSPSILTYLSVLN